MISLIEYASIRELYVNHDGSVRTNKFKIVKDAFRDSDIHLQKELELSENELRDLHTILNRFFKEKK